MRALGCDRPLDLETVNGPGVDGAVGKGGHPVRRRHGDGMDILPAKPHRLQHANEEILRRRRTDIGDAAPFKIGQIADGRMARDQNHLIIDVANDGCDLPKALNRRSGGKDRRNFAHRAEIQRTAVQRFDHEMPRLEEAVVDAEVFWFQPGRAQDEFITALAVRRTQLPPASTGRSTAATQHGEGQTGTHGTKQGSAVMPSIGHT